MEDILVRVKALIHKNIGRSDVDLMKTFEDVKHELMSLNDTDTEKQNIAEGIDEKVRITYTVSYFYDIHLYNPRLILCLKYFNSYRRSPQKT